MAGAVLAFIGADYDAMLEEFKGMGVLPVGPARYCSPRHGMPFNSMNIIARHVTGCHLH
jgi:hypothetical protein